MFFPLSDSDKPTDPPLKMYLIANDGQRLEAFLRDELGLVKGVDYVRHANNQRGGIRYFDIYTDSAIQRISEQADRVAQKSHVASTRKRGDFGIT